MPDPSPLFTSRRERRLWTWAIVLVVTIYSTLGLASTIVGRVNESLLVAAFAGCLLLVAVTVLTQGLRVRPGGLEVGVVVGIVTVYVLLGVRMAIPERSHLMEYSVLAVIVYEALAERRCAGRRVPLVPVIAFLVTSLAGFVDELIQAVIPSRVFDWEDVVFNVLAAFSAVVGMVILGWARAWTKARLEKART